MRRAGAINRVFMDEGDWRTLMLLTLVYGLWGCLVFGAHGVPELATALVLTPLLTLFSSLQHELLHGHPFRRRIFNHMLGSVPIGVIVPYLRFRDTHLEHHRDTQLCDPYDDPESWYQMRSEWERRGKFSKRLFNFNNMLAGRMLIGPFIGMTGFVLWDIKRIRAGQYHIAWKWLAHFATLVPLVTLIGFFGTISVWMYLVAAYLGMSLLMVRTFLEHQAHEKARGRSVIIESRGLFSFLFLNNSLHAVHHAHPKVAWYRLPELYQRNRERFLQMNEGYQLASYGEVFRRFFLKQKEPVPYPLERPGGRGR